MALAAASSVGPTHRGRHHHRKGGDDEPNDTTNATRAAAPPAPGPSGEPYSCPAAPRLPRPPASTVPPGKRLNRVNATLTHARRQFSPIVSPSPPRMTRKTIKALFSRNFYMGVTDRGRAIPQWGGHNACRVDYPNRETISTLKELLRPGLKTLAPSAGSATHPPVVTGPPRARCPWDARNRSLPPTRSPGSKTVVGPTKRVVNPAPPGTTQRRGPPIHRPGRDPQRRHRVMGLSTENERLLLHQEPGHFLACVRKRPLASS